jgi:tape measure domain-containing protein
VATEKLDIVVGVNADGAVRGFGRTREGLKSISDQLGAAQVAFQRLTTLAVGFGALRGSFAVVDSYGSLSARLRLASESQAEFNGAFAGVVSLATSARAPLEETAQLYTRLSGAVRALGGSQRETLQISEAAALSLRISGASAQETSSALLQFAQALGSGVLQGDELKSLAETAPRLLKAIADGAGLSVGALKSLGAEGKLTADLVGNSLIKVLAELRAEAATLPPTVGGAFTLVANAAKLYVGELDQASGVSRRFAGIVEGLARNMGEVGTVAATAGAVIFASYTGRALAAALGMALAHSQMATAMAASTAAAVAAAAAQSRYATVLLGAGTAVRTVAGVFGGPLGIIALLGSAAAAWALFGERAETAMQKATRQSRDLVKRLEEANAKLREQATFGEGEKGERASLRAQVAARVRAAQAEIESIAAQEANPPKFVTRGEDVVFRRAIPQRRREAQAALAAALREIDLIDENETLSARAASRGLKPPAPTLESVDKEFKTRFGIERKYLEDRKKINEAYDAERAKAVAAGDQARVAELDTRRKQNLAAARKEFDDAVKGTGEKERLATRRELFDADLTLTRARLAAEGAAYAELYADQLLTTEEFYGEKRRLLAEDAEAEARDLAKRRAENESYLAGLTRALPRARDRNERLEIEDKIFEAKNKQKQIDTELAVLASRRVTAAAELGAEAEKAARERATLLAQTQRSIRERQGQGTDEDVRAGVLEKNRELLRTLSIEFGEAGRQAGEKIVDLEVAESQLRALEAKFSEALNRMKTLEESINLQRQAGVITEYDAREKIIELYRRTGAELDLLLPKMQSLAASSGNQGNVTAAANAANRVRELVATQSQAETQIRGGLTDAFKGLFTSIATGAKGGKAALLDMLSSFARKALEVINQRLAEQLVNGFFSAAKGSGFFGNLFGGASPAPVFPDLPIAVGHTGGLVGALAGTRLGSPLAFAGAPRYHAGGIIGLRPNEVPVIAKRGEEMLTEDDPRHRRNGGGATTVNLTIHSGEAGEARAPRTEQFGRVIAQLVTQEIANQKRPGGLLAA